MNKRDAATTTCRAVYSVAAYTGLVTGFSLLAQAFGLDRGFYSGAACAVVAGILWIILEDQRQ